MNNLGKNKQRPRKCEKSNNDTSPNNTSASSAALGTLETTSNCPPPPRNVEQQLNQILRQEKVDRQGVMDVKDQLDQILSTGHRNQVQSNQISDKECLNRGLCNDKSSILQESSQISHQGNVEDQLNLVLGEKAPMEFMHLATQTNSFPNASVFTTPPVALSETPDISKLLQQVLNTDDKTNSTRTGPQTSSKNMAVIYPQVVQSSQSSIGQQLDRAMSQEHKVFDKKGEKEGESDLKQKKPKVCSRYI